MTATSGQPTEADAGADACPLDPNDQLLKEPIDEKWIDIADDRICREFVRQLQQQENAVVTTNRDTRLVNVRALESLIRQLEKISKRTSARDVRRSTKDASNDDDSLATLERRVSPVLERAVAELRSKNANGQ